MATMQWLLLATCLLHAASLAHSFRYLGCFVDSKSRDLPALAGSSGSMSVGQCNSLCNSRNYRYFGLQYSKECWCGNSYGRHGSRATGECSKRCSGDRDAFCGASWRNSIYATELTPGMQYIGCFSDTSSRDLPVLALQGAVRIGKCYEQCRQRGFAFFGAQNGNECWCGNGYGSHGARPPTECSARCSDDKSAVCGAGWRNSVYSTGLNPATSLFGSSTDSSTLKGQLRIALRTQFTTLPTGVVCYNCLIRSWQKREVDVKSKVFPVSDLDSFTRSYPAKVRDKLLVLRFGANAKTTFDDSQVDIRQDHAVRKSYVGMARRVDGNVEFLMVAGEVVASVVPKYNVHSRQVCKKILWVFKKCRTETTHIRRGLHASEVTSVDRALASETFRMFGEKANL